MDVLYQTALRNYAAISLQVPSILSILPLRPYQYCGLLPVCGAPGSIVGSFQYCWLVQIFSRILGAIASILGIIASIVWATVWSLWIIFVDCCLACVSIVGPCQYCGHSWQYYGANGHIVRLVSVFLGTASIVAILGSIMGPLDVFLGVCKYCGELPVLWPFLAVLWGH